MKLIAIFDNGGGTTLQITDGAGNEFAAYFSDPRSAAENYGIAAHDQSVAGWDGHDPESMALDPSYDEIQNGGYRVYDASDVAEERGGEESSWNNIRGFLAALDALATEAPDTYAHP
jgi:hypothetical protein